MTCNTNQIKSTALETHTRSNAAVLQRRASIHAIVSANTRSCLAGASPIMSACHMPGYTLSVLSLLRARSCRSRLHTWGRKQAPSEQPPLRFERVDLTTPAAGNDTHETLGSQILSASPCSTRKGIVTSARCFCEQVSTKGESESHGEHSKIESSTVAIKMRQNSSIQGGDTPIQTQQTVKGRRVAQQETKLASRSSENLSSTAAVCRRGFIVYRIGSRYVCV